MKRRLLVAVVLLAALSSSSCGYTLAGRGSFLPDNIKTIGVPEFGNRTPYYELAPVLAQAVRTELIGRGKYKVLPQETDVDAVLTADVVSVTLVPSAFNSEQQATRYAISVNVSIQLVQTRDKRVLWQNASQSFREEYSLSSDGGATLDAASFFGQSSNAAERMASDFARTIVSAILEGF